MDKEQPKKCFCARCFLPIEEADKVDVEGQNFHRTCCMCCMCRTIPKSIKMFYGHVFCNDCFKSHVLGRLKGEAPRVYASGWRAQWAPGAEPQKEEDEKEEPQQHTSEEPCKKCICARCLQAVDTADKVDIGGQHFHPQCAKCYFCQCVPNSNLKIYYGQVFCEDCFNRHVMNRNRENPSEFFKTCFEQWQNAQFAEGMRQFMGCSKEGAVPFVFCRCAGQEWAQPDTRKCKVRKTSKIFAAATPANVSIPENESLEDLYCENRTEMSDILESTHTNEDSVLAAEKIEKLTKYLHELPSPERSGKKWKNFVEADKISLTSFGWVDLQDSKVNGGMDCPKCLWQCGGPIYVQSAELQQVRCGNVFE